MSAWVVWSLDERTEKWLQVDEGTAEETRRVAARYNDAARQHGVAAVFVATPRGGTPVRPAVMPAPEPEPEPESAPDLEYRVEMRMARTGTWATDTGRWVPWGDSRTFPTAEAAFDFLDRQAGDFSRVEWRVASSPVRREWTPVERPERGKDGAPAGSVDGTGRVDVVPAGPPG